MATLMQFHTVVIWVLVVDLATAFLTNSSVDLTACSKQQTATFEGRAWIQRKMVL